MKKLLILTSLLVSGGCGGFKIMKNSN